MHRGGIYAKVIAILLTVLVGLVIGARPTRAAFTAPTIIYPSHNSTVPLAPLTIQWSDVGAASYELKFYENNWGPLLVD